MKIIVVLKPMGRYKGCCKGFYVQHRRIKHITINSDLPEVIQRVILAHEIAHSVLHTNITAAFHEFTLFDELLDFKFRVMKRKGYKLESPIVSHGNFLKTIE